MENDKVDPFAMGSISYSELSKINKHQKHVQASSNNCTQHHRSGQMETKVPKQPHQGFIILFHFFLCCFIQQTGLIAVGGTSMNDWSPTPIHATFPLWFPVH